MAGVPAGEEKPRRRSAKRERAPRETVPAGNGDLASDVYEWIREAIHAGTLTIGERVTEVDLAARFGVSRTPVRDAITRLEADGLLTNEPRRGLVITDLTHQQLVELYFMREVLEGAAARLAAQSASDIEIATLAELNETEMANPTDYKLLSDINRQFHRMLALSAHNQYLLRSLSQLSVSMSLLPSLIGEGQRARIAMDEHRAIIDALKRRDREAAEIAARDHVRSSQQHRLLINLKSRERKV